MPVYQIDIQKRIGSEYWTNRYFRMSDTIGVSAVAALDIADQEKTFHGTVVEFISYRVSTVELNDGQFVSGTLSGTGAINVGDYYPLWNVIRCRFGVFGTRPYYKLYRGCLGEDVATGSVIAPTLLAIVTAAMVQIAELTTTGTGDPFSGSSVDSRVQMRQLRRGKRKRSTPVLPV